VEVDNARKKAPLASVSGHTTANDVLCYYMATLSMQTFNKLNIFAHRYRWRLSIYEAIIDLPGPSIKRNDVRPIRIFKKHLRFMRIRFNNAPSLSSEFSAIFLSHQRNTGQPMTVQMYSRLEFEFVKLVFRHPNV